MSDKQLDYLRISVIAENTVMPKSRFLGQNGVSYLLEARRESGTRIIVVDVGQNHYALMHNMKILGINPSDIDMIVMTHCHYDHTAGIAALLSEIGRQNVPVVGHPDSFRLSFRTEPSLEHKGMTLEDQPDNIVANGGRLFLTRDPIQLMPGLTTTGEVPRLTDFEHPGHTRYTIRDGRIEVDMMEDDVSVVANVRDCGIVIVTGCSHAGIVNIAKHAMNMFAGQPLYGIIGGFHLIDVGNVRIQRTVEELVRLNPHLVSAGHCTGFEAQVALLNGLGDRFVQLTCGLEFTVSSDAYRFKGS